MPDADPGRISLRPNRQRFTETVQGRDRFRRGEDLERQTRRPVDSATGKPDTWHLVQPPEKLTARGGPASSCLMVRNVQLLVHARRRGRGGGPDCATLVA